MPNDNEPKAADGNTSQPLLADLVKLTVGVPVFAERLDDLFAVLPFCTTEKESVVGENDSAGAIVTVRVTANVASA